MEMKLAEINIEEARALSIKTVDLFRKEFNFKSDSTMEELAPKFLLAIASLIITKTSIEEMMQIETVHLKVSCNKEGLDS
jgi:hypothetical protein